MTNTHCAIRRAGELLRQIEPAKNQHDARARVGASPSSRKQAMANAGMSPDQGEQALCVPAPDFKAMVEAEKLRPPPPRIPASASGTSRMCSLAEQTTFLSHDEA